MIAAGTAGVAWFGAALAGRGFAAVVLAVAAGACVAFVWLGVYSPADPEHRRFGRLAIDGRVLLALEVGVIVAGGAAIWATWSRAAGETYLTLAFVDLVVRYPRLLALLRKEPAATPIPRSRPEDRGR